MSAPRDAARRQTLLAEAFRAYESGDAKTALRLARKLPQEAGGQYLIGLCLLGDDPATALRHLTRAGQISPATPALDLATGRAHFALGRLDLALPVLERAAAAAPDSVAILQTLASTLALCHRLAEAADMFQRAQARDPSYARGWRNLAAIRLELGDASAAIDAARHALTLDTADRSAARTLALALRQAGDEAACTTLLTALIANAPYDADLLADLADGARRRGDDDEAVRLLTRAIAAAPDRAALQFALGEAHRRAGNTPAALAAYRQALTLEPEDRLGAAAALAVLTADTAELPRAFVQALFDDYSPRFDRALCDTLSYAAPDLLRAAASPIAAGTRALDLGCGTGLAGLALRDAVARLDGVDLSPRMIDQARARKIYDALAVAALEDRLAITPPGSYDLVIAADVLVYLGALADVFGQIARVLAAGGRFVATLERLGDADAPYRLLESRRFAHHPDYVATAVTSAGLIARRIEPVSVRREHGRDVPGLLLVAERP